jgi:sulfate adenylyltransferase
MKFATAATLLLATSVSAFVPATNFGASNKQSLTKNVAFVNGLVSGPTTASQLEMAKQVPHGGGDLVDLMIEESKHAAEIESCTTELQLTPRQLCDTELIINGGFTPLTGFMDEETYNHVVENVELPDGTIFGLPVVFDTDSEELGVGSKILLKDGDRAIATFEVTSKYTPNKPLECLKCYGTSEIEHPGSLMVATERGKYYMGGKLTGLN